MAAKKRASSRKASPTKKAPSTHWFLRYHVTLWVVMIAVTILTTLVVLRLPESPSSQPVLHKAQKQKEHRSRVRRSVSRPSTTHSTSHMASSHKRTSPLRSYEEETETLETRIKELDLALVQTLVVHGYDPVGIQHGNVETRKNKGHAYQFQRLELAMPGDVQGFLQALQKNVALLVQGGMASYDQTGKQVALSLDGLTTHIIRFTQGRTSGKQAARLPREGARMVIVLDDLGRSLEAGERLAALPFPVTFSVMPYEPHSREVALLATHKGEELILHLPMQPTSYPKADPGPGALFVHMSRQTISEIVTKDIACVPGICGANNHMGSRFTQDEPGMDAALEVLGQHGLFFLDSVTTSRSCGQQMAKKHHVPYLRRDVFLDNVRDIKAIVYQLRKAQALARKKGTCIAIGHPYPETLAALAEWGKVRDPAIRLVCLRDLLP